MSTNKSFIERCVQFQEEPLAAVEVGESSSPPDPMKVSEERQEQVSVGASRFQEELPEKEE